MFTPEEAKKLLEHRRQILFEKNYQEGSETIDQMFDRVAEAAARSSSNLATAETFKSALKGNFIIPGGRILRTLGRKGEKGLPANCYGCPSPKDDLCSIYDTKKILAKLLQKQGGVGVLVDLRPKGAPIKTSGGVASGSVTFMESFQNDVQVIEVGGNRRGALLIAMNCNHPEILDFINCKRDTSKITNANISVMVNDEFVYAVLNNKVIDLVHGGKKYGELPARHIWDKIIESNHASGEPGVIFIDRIKRTNNTEYFQPVNIVNACWTGDTKILTVYGSESFEELYKRHEENILVPSFNEQEGCLEYKIMHSIRTTGVKKTIVIELENGTKLKCTADHKLYYHGYGGIAVIEAKDLVPGDRLVNHCSDASSATFYEEVVSISEGGTQIVYNATVDDNHNYYVDIGDGRSILSKNCSEQVLPAFVKEDGEYVVGACNLGSLNLYDIWLAADKDDEKFFQKLSYYTKVITRFLDGVTDEFIRMIDVVLETETDPLIIKVFKGVAETQRQARRIGIGIMGLHSLFVGKKIRYGSQKSQEFTSEIMKHIFRASFSETICMAKETDCFPSFNYSEFRKTRAYSIAQRIFDPEEFADLEEMLAYFGMRNSSMLNCAPTGSTSIFAMVSSGLEPIFDINGVKRKDRLGEHIIYDRSVIDMFEGKTDSMESLMKNAKAECGDYFVSAMDIPPADQLHILVNIDRFIDCNASKTINVREHETIETTRDVFYKSLIMPEIKSLTYYRDNSRSNVISSLRKRTRPSILSGNTWKRKYKGSSFFITINTDVKEGFPYEMFVSMLKKDQEIGKGLLLSDYITSKTIILHHAFKNMKDTEAITAMINQMKVVKDGTSYKDEVVNKQFSSIDHMLAEIIEESLNIIGGDLKEEEKECEEGFECPNCKAKTLYRKDGTNCLLCSSCFYSECRIISKM